MCIMNARIYVRANINDIKQHYPDQFYNPAIDRLYRLKEFVGKDSRVVLSFLLYLSEIVAIRLNIIFVFFKVEISPLDNKINKNI